MNRMFFDIDGIQIFSEDIFNSFRFVILEILKKRDRMTRLEKSLKGEEFIIYFAEKGIKTGGRKLEFSCNSVNDFLRKLKNELHKERCLFDD